MSYNKNNQNQGKGKALDDYIEVNERIIACYNKYPDGSIQTEIISINDDRVVIKAYAYRDREDPRPATGHAEEIRSASYINKTSALENGETSAVGRALALLGFHVKKSIASREEVANAIAQQEQLKEAEKESPRQDPNDKQLIITVLSKWETLGSDKVAFSNWVLSKYQKGIEELTIGEIKSIDQTLTKKLLEKKKGA